ncbi:condensation domain-containing protein [Actinomadura sp. ATCC 31491]|uniref:Condensation domain-containing protein n=1 Tax=Actinomadura luzonensis TaxID=2805427 RepID=A0ABT0FU52_9ACTN|nr:condensation domain-containing protein [Actinomadura luzonensis]MCK2215703.1 condensation domain-containing protein [Actinomadura luzonensis]
MTGLEQAVVVFAAAPPRVPEGPLTWGQRLMWRATHLMGGSRAFLNCPWVLPVYGRREPADVLGGLRALLERHESLRTTFVAGPEGPVQRVAATGELPVALTVPEPGESALRAAARVAADLGRVPFDHGRDLPLRCSLVLKDGRPKAVALAFSHLAVDYQALSLLAAEWKALLRGEELPPPSWQPADQVELERSPVFLARSARSLAYWRPVLEEVPLEVFDHAPGEPEDPRFIEVELESVALAAAATALAARWTLSTTSVLLAACAAVLATASGRERAVMQLVHGNRRDPRTRGLVATVGQDALFVLDLAEQDFAALCRAAHRNALTAYRNACYDPYAMQAMREEVGRRRGREPDLDAFFNDRRGTGEWPSLPAAAPPSRTSVRDAWPGVRFKAFFTVGTAPDTGQLSLIADTAYLGRETARAMLLAVESLLVRAVREDVPMAGAARLCGMPRPGGLPAASR